MRRAWFLMAAAAFFGACSSGSSGCDGGGGKSSSGESSGFSASGAPVAGGGGEAVSFQRTGMGLGPRGADGKISSSLSNSSGTVVASTGTAASAAAGGAPASVSAADPSRATQNILCGGFPGLPDDCMSSPQLLDIQRKCCPTGVVFVCRAIPGGARLTGRGCSTPSLSAAMPSAPPAPAATQP